MKRIHLIFVTSFILFSSVLVCASETDSISVDGVKREYLLHIPGSFTGIDSVPLIIGLHPLGTTASQFEMITGFSTLSDQHNFIVVYPNGIGNSWNAGGCCNPAMDQNVDDVKFISELIDTLTVLYNIDSARVFVAGFSNGSIMAYRLANELSERIAAIGCTAGQSFQDIIDPADPVAIIHFHALDDNAVNFNGGLAGSYTYKSVPDVLNTWKGFNDCISDSVIIRDEDGIKGYLWPSPDNKSNILLYTSESGAHSWTMNSRLGISNLMWEFFETGSTIVPPKYDSIHLDELNRTYKVHLPNNYYTGLNRGTKYPLILAFHGWYQNSDMMESYTKMSTKANREDFIVSYLNYVGPPPDMSWNYFMNESKPDDIGFALQVLDTLISRYPVDTARIYLIGFSDGCGMADRLPFIRPGRFKGIGTVSGMIEFDETIETSKVPLIHINYTGDVAWSDIVSKIPYWVGLNGCNPDADTTVNARGITGRRWENPDGKNHVVVISTGGGSHEWVSTSYVSATNLIWEFFETGNAIPNVDTPVVVRPTALFENGLFRIYPNPANEKLNIRSYSPVKSVCYISLYDNIGNLLYSRQKDGLKFNEILEIDLSRIPPGLYHLQIINSEGIITEKVVIE